MIVDVQNDFISGSLAIVNCPARQDGEDVVAPINLLLDTVPFHQCYYRCKYFLGHPNIFALQTNVRDISPQPGLAPLRPRVLH